MSDHLFNGLNPKRSAEHDNNIYACPVCSQRNIKLLGSVWRNYYNIKEFRLDTERWFASCETCGTVMRYPLVDYSNYRRYGEDYYNQVNPGQSVEEHAEWHFESFQRQNYDSVRQFLLQHAPVAEFPRWLDVGSVGYPTTFTDYDFTTIEPDARIVNLGRKLFAGWRLWNRNKIQCAVVESYKPQDPLDGVLFNNSFYCLTTPGRTLEKVGGILQKNGRMLITISTYFNNAVPFRGDALISRIEDILPGETLWVFYNEWSLRYLCASHGFALKHAGNITAYEHKTMQTYLFERDLSCKPDEGWLQKSKDHMENKWRECFEEFDRQTCETLRSIDRPDIFLVGPLDVLLEIGRKAPLHGIAGIVASDLELDDVICNGLKFCTVREMKRQIDAAPDGHYEVAICDFQQPWEIRARFNEMLSRKVRFKSPNRFSGFPSTELVFGGQLVPIKGLTFVDEE